MFFAFITASHPKSSPSTANGHLLVPVLTSIFTRLNGGLHCLLRILASAHTMSACLYHKNWLVVYLPLWKLWVKVSWDDDIPNIWKVIKHVPNHQAVWHIRSAYLWNAMNLRLIPWRKYGADFQKLSSSVTLCFHEELVKMKKFRTKKNVKICENHAIPQYILYPLVICYIAMV